MSTTEPGLNGHDQQHRGRFALPLTLPPADSRPARRLGLVLQPLADTAAFREDEPLEVKEFRRQPDVFTAHLPGTLQCQGFVTRRAGSFQNQFQVLCGGLLDDARVMGQATLIAYTPVLDWVSRRVALMATPLVYHRRSPFERLRALAAVDPLFKAYVRWDQALSKYVLGHIPLSPDERSVVEAAAWPNTEAIEEALTPLAVDTLEQLLAGNPELAVRLQAKEEG